MKKEYMNDALTIWFASIVVKIFVHLSSGNGLVLVYLIGDQKIPELISG